MSERSPSIEERFLAISAKFEAQTSAMDKLTRSLEQVKADAAESQKALETKVEQQGQTIRAQGEKIEQLERKETSSSSSSITAASSSEPVETGKFVEGWRIVFGLGALVPYAIALGSLKDGDVRLVAASKMFEIFGLVCSTAAALGNPRNFGSRNEKLCIGLCSLSPAAYRAIAGLTLEGASMDILIGACIYALIVPPVYLGAAKLYSNLSDHKLGAAVTGLFKSLSGVLSPMLYISAESLRCIMDSTPDAKIDGLGYIERCGNPSHPTWWVSVFLGISWVLTYVIPPLLPSDRTMTWSNVMNLNMGRIEGLQFILFSTFSILALVMYALTDEDGTELSDFLLGLIKFMLLNFTILLLIVLYEYIIKPAICRRSTTSEEEPSSSPVTNPNSDAFSFADQTNSIGL
mmetsp:Transcript_6672/g.12050  ORF Transcript_6672/g.12050 Transcript_6672/m.12050 type:complete len:405 (+) Transcript_6672:214-1428(+)